MLKLIKAIDYDLTSMLKSIGYAVVVLAVLLVFNGSALAADEWVGSHFFGKEGHTWNLVDRAIYFFASVVLIYVALWLYQREWSQKLVSRNRDEADRIIEEADKNRKKEIGTPHARIVMAVLMADVARFALIVVPSAWLAIAL